MKINFVSMFNELQKGDLLFNALICKNYLQQVFKIMNFMMFQNDLMGICQDNLAIIIDCLQSAELQDTFVSKRKSRDLRGESKQNLNKVQPTFNDFLFLVLLNKWEKLLSKIKENIQHTEVYESLKNDIVSLRLDLTKVLEDRERYEETQDDVELEQNLHTFRV